MKSLRLLLVALAVVTAVLADQPSKSADTKHDDDDIVDKLLERTGEITHELFKFEEQLDERLDPERIQRAGSLRHRVESLEDSTCEDDEHQCGGDDPQCISNLFVCDGHKDCRNGEDEKDCTIPAKAGDKFIGDVVYDHCTKRKPDHITLVVESVSTAAFFPGYPELHVHLEMHADDDHQEVEASLPADAHYSFAEHTLFVHAPENDGLGLHGEFDGHNFDRFVGEIIHESSDEPCAEFIFHRETEDDHHDDDHDDDDDDHHDDDDHKDHKKDHHKDRDHHKGRNHH